MRRALRIRKFLESGGSRCIGRALRLGGMDQLLRIYGPRESRRTGFLHAASVYYCWMEPTSMRRTPPHNILDTVAPTYTAHPHLNGISWACIATSREMAVCLQYKSGANSVSHTFGHNNEVCGICITIMAAEKPLTNVTCMKYFAKEIWQVHRGEVDLHDIECDKVILYAKMQIETIYLIG